MGEWKRAEISYLKANRNACDLCGHPIAIRYWGAEVDGEAKMFCSPEHEQLYHAHQLTVRRNGTERGTLKTSMGCLIRGQAPI